MVSRAGGPYLPLKGGGRQHLPRPCAGANAVGWGSAPRRPAFGIIAAATRPPPRSPPPKPGGAALPPSRGGSAPPRAPTPPERGGGPDASPPRVGGGKGGGGGVPLLADPHLGSSRPQLDPHPAPPRQVGGSPTSPFQGEVSPRSGPNTSLTE